MSTTITAAALPGDLEALLRQLRLPHARAIAADVERLNVRTVYAADGDDALQTHELHYPGEYIVSVQRGDGLSVR